MIVYINSQMIFLAIMMIIVSLLISSTNESKKTFKSYIMYAIIMSLPLLDLYANYTTALENIKAFKDRNVLKCSDGGGGYSKSTKYRVTLDDGWKLDKDYFTKDSLLIRADKCEEF